IHPPGCEGEEESQICDCSLTLFRRISQIGSAKVVETRLPLEIVVCPGKQIKPGKRRGVRVTLRRGRRVAGAAAAARKLYHARVRTSRFSLAFSAANVVQCHSSPSSTLRGLSR